MLCLLFSVLNVLVWKFELFVSCMCVLNYILIGSGNWLVIFPDIL